MAIILNLTQHDSTPEQRDAGVIDFLSIEDRKLLDFKFNGQEPLTDELSIEMEYRAEKLSVLAIDKVNEIFKSDVQLNQLFYVMIGGAPFFMDVLKVRLLRAGFYPVYALSERIAIEKEIDGKIIKTSEFKHLGFYPNVIHHH